MADPSQELDSADEAFYDRGGLCCAQCGTAEEGGDFSKGHCGWENVWRCARCTGLYKWRCLGCGFEVCTACARLCRRMQPFLFSTRLFSRALYCTPGGGAPVWAPHEFMYVPMKRQRKRPRRK